MFDFNDLTGKQKHLGGEIFQEKKQKERIILTIFVVMGIVILNLILYFMTNV